MSRNQKRLSDSSESESELELQPTQVAQKLPPPSSEEEESSDSDSDSKSNARVENPNVVVTSPKRCVEATPKAKNSESGKKSNLFQRVWSEADEVAILEGMIEFESNNKSAPLADLSSFHSFIKEKYEITDGSRTQLQDKIRRMKAKYDNKSNNTKKTNLSRPHDQLVYNLSKQIWGNKANDAVVENKRRRLNLNYCGATAMEERVLVYGRDLFEQGRGLKEEEEEWKKLRVEELQIQIKLLGARLQQTKRALKDHS